jgi:hypothetical protein
VLADAVIVLAILLKTVLMLVEIPGTTAIAAKVTSAAINAYSIMSWPRVSLQKPSLDIFTSRLPNNQPEDTHLCMSRNTSLLLLDRRVANFAQAVTRMINTAFLRLMAEEWIRGELRGIRQ